MALDKDQRNELLRIFQEEFDYYIEMMAYAENAIDRIMWFHIQNEDRRQPKDDEEAYMTLRPGVPERAPGYHHDIDWDKDYEMTAEGLARMNRDQQAWDDEIEQLEIEAKDAHERKSEASAALKELFYFREIMTSPPADERRSPALLAWWRAHH